MSQRWRRERALELPQNCHHGSDRWRLRGVGGDDSCLRVRPFARATLGLRLQALRTDSPRFENHEGRRCMSFVNWWETEETMRAHSWGMSAQNAWKPGDRCPRCGSDHLTAVIAPSGSIFGQVERLICLASECGWKEEKMVSERHDDGETCRRIDRARASKRSSAPPWRGR